MADFKASVPIRSEADGADERVHVKLVDGTTPSQQASVSASGELSVVATDLDIRDLVAASDAVEVYGSDDGGTTQRVLKTDAAGRLDVVVSASAAGDEINDYQTSAAVAKDGVVNHDYTVSVGKTLRLTQIIAAGAGRKKVELISDPLGTPVSHFVSFGEAHADAGATFATPLEFAASTVLRLAVTNTDNSASDLYSNLIGQEV